MRVIKEINLDGLAVQVKELTVGEIREWLASKTQPGDLVDSMLFQSLDLTDLAFFTDLTPDAINALVPSDIERVITVAQEINAAFFEMRERVTVLGKKILAQQTESSPLSGQPPT